MRERRQSSGLCTCNPSWTGSDCSKQICEDIAVDMEIASRRILGRWSVTRITEVRVVRSACVMVTIMCEWRKCVEGQCLCEPVLRRSLRDSSVYTWFPTQEYRREGVNAVKARSFLRNENVSDWKIRKMQLDIIRMCL